MMRAVLLLLGVSLVCAESKKEDKSQDNAVLRQRRDVLLRHGDLSAYITGNGESNGDHGSEAADIIKACSALRMRGHGDNGHCAHSIAVGGFLDSEDLTIERQLAICSLIDAFCLRIENATVGSESEVSGENENQDAWNANRHCSSPNRLVWTGNAYGCVYVSTSTLDRHGADAACERRQGHLIRVTDTTLYNGILPFLSSSRQYYIDGSDAAREGVWTFSDGNPLSFWPAGTTHSNSTSTNCLTIYSRHFHPYACSGRTYYICHLA